MKILNKIFAIAVVIAVIFAFVPVVVAQENAKININKASAEELVKLKGIGEKQAAEIVAYREKSGPFKTLEDFKKVKGIGDKKYEQLKDKISVE